MRFTTLVAPSLALVAVPLVLLAGACVGDDPATVDRAADDGGSDSAATGDGNPATPTLSVTTATKSVSVLPSTSAKVEVEVTRGAGFAGAVKISLTGLPGGTSAEPITIAANETNGTVTVTASGAPVQGVAAIGISAQSADGALGAKAALELVVRGVAGSLDKSFAGTGIVADASLLIEAIALQKDGKIVLGGSAPKETVFADNFGAVRLDPTGKLDTTFGSGGRVKTTFGFASPGFSRYVTGVVVDDATGNIFLGGSAVVDGDLKLAALRLDKSGKVDPNFGGAGKGGASGPRLARGVAMRAQGANLFVAGFDRQVIGGNAVVGRLNANGFDSTFAAQGMATATGNYLSAHDALVQSDGKILVCGASGQIGVDTIASVVRFNADGTLDTGYGANGQYDYNLVGTNEDAFAMALLPNDKVVVVGDKLVGGGSIGEISVAVVGSNGRLDSTFGVPLMHVGDGAAPASATAVVVQPDALIVVVGYAYKSSVFQQFVWRFLKSGAPDPAFNSGTPIFTPAASDSDLPNDAVIDAYQRVLVVTDNTITRYWL